MSKKSRERETPRLSEDDRTVTREASSDAPLLTVERFLRTLKNRELGEAYLAVEKLRPVRRLTQEDWQNDYDAWLKAPRG